MYSGISNQMNVSDEFPDIGEMMDINNHPSNMLPEPGHSPILQHSTRMAGDVLPLRGSEASEYTPTDDRAIMGQIANTSPNRTASDRTNVKSIKIRKMH